MPGRTADLPTHSLNTHIGERTSGDHCRGPRHRREPASALGRPSDDLTLGQIHPQGNPLPRWPLEPADIRPRPKDHPHGMRPVDVVFAYHGHPGAIHQLVHDRTLGDRARQR